jgi:hypothetical protein
MLYRMPDRLVRDLVLHYVAMSAPRPDRDRLLGAIVSAMCEVPVTAAMIYETDRTRVRCARIAVPAQHGQSFARIFPNARRLKDPAPGLAAFRLTAEAARDATEREN